MAHPYNMAAGNEVIAAAVALAHARIPGTSTVPWQAMEHLLRAVAGYEAAVATVHTNGPDIDAETFEIVNGEGQVVATWVEPPNGRDLLAGWATLVIDEPAANA
jgi:threonine dehydratase